MISLASHVLLAVAGILLGPDAIGPASAASSCTASSTTQRVSVVELYTSEGCSSCPPADRWLSALMRDANAARLLPLAFHVDYWDYIGWKDPFAQAAFSRRQRELAERRGTGTVFTPQVVVDGQDFPGWRDSRRLGVSLSAPERQPARAELSMDLREQSATRWNVSLRGKILDGAAQRRAVAFLALYENGLETRVKAGENAGTTLRHDFVVREWLGPFHATSSGMIGADLDIAIRTDWKQQDLRLAAVAYATPTGEVLQALSMPACRVSTN